MNACAAVVEARIAPNAPRPEHCSSEGRFEVTDYIKHMVDRFLSWCLPDNFAPDGGISFIRPYSGQMPTGTNLFDSTQAEDMIRHMLQGAPQVAAQRSNRQKAVFQWGCESFGDHHMTNQQQRALRFLEESIELYQACGGDRVLAHKLVNFVLDRPAGTISQELGGVGVTLLALAHAAGLDADHEESREIYRVLQKPRSHFTARNDAKNAAGFNVVPINQDGTP